MSTINDRIVIAIDQQDGLAVPEGKIIATIRQLITQINLGQPVPALGQYELVAGLRLARRQGLINEIAFAFDGQLFPVDEDGNQYIWPPGFPGDAMGLLLDGILSDHDSVTVLNEGV
jgi:hypothetical protein